MGATGIHTLNQVKPGRHHAHSDKYDDYIGRFPKCAVGTSGRLDIMSLNTARAPEGTSALSKVKEVNESQGGGKALIGDSEIEMI